MIYKVEKFIGKHRLLATGDKVLVALSGGADSVALLVALQKLNYRCEAVHCNFHLRDEESDRDERFVQELCKRRKVMLHTVHFNTAEHAEKHKISIEMAARELRYDVFEKLRKQTGAIAIAVAHHRDDNAETLMLNLIRGTGIKGLRGIQPRNGHIIRPLLCVGREDIIEYLKWREEEFVTDSTNLTTDYTRNKIRLEILPKMAEINPSVNESLAAVARHLSDAELIYRHAIEESIARVKKNNIIDITSLLKEVAPATVLHEILSPLGFNASQIGNIADSLESNSGKSFSSKEHLLVKDRNSLIITTNEIGEIIPQTIPENGTTETHFGKLHSELTDFDGNIPKQHDTVSLDFDKLKMPLTLRHARNGEKFCPFGMHGTKLISDYLTDRKRSIIEKRRQLVVADAEDSVVWLVNERTAAPYCVDKKTKKVLRLKWESKA